MKKFKKASTIEKQKAALLSRTFSKKEFVCFALNNNNPKHAKSKKNPLLKRKTKIVLLRKKPSSFKLKKAFFLSLFEKHKTIISKLLSLPENRDSSSSYTTFFALHRTPFTLLSRAMSADKIKKSDRDKIKKSSEEKTTQISMISTDSLESTFLASLASPAQGDLLSLKHKKALDRSNLSICKICVDNVKHVVETRKVRKGRITHRVPKITKIQRQEGKAMTLLTENAYSRKTSNLKTASLTDGSFYPNPEALKDSRIVSQNPEFLNFFTESCLFFGSSLNQKKNKAMVSATSGKANNPERLEKKAKKRWFLKQPFFFQKSMTNSAALKYCLSEEFFDCANNKGESIEKKKKLHRFALQNRANLYLKWW